MSLCPDADGDGYRSAVCGGDDCNDFDPARSPAAMERCNGDVDDDCDGLADRADGVCVPCPAGYTGTFDGDCRDVDECAVAGYCGSGATSCTNLPGSFACACRAGYVPASATGGLCVNVDECAAATNPCGAGTCVDYEGAYTCSCAMGYRLVGSPSLSCVDVDECAERRDDCDTAPAAVCNNTDGGFECVCPPGYAGDGRGTNGCSDVDECLLGADDCDEDPAAACVNGMGSFACACPSGFVGDGRGASGCTDVDECAAGASCGVGTCRNTLGAYECGCPAGFAFDGATCVDVDECALGTDDCDDSPRAWCFNGYPGFTCGCPGGYVGDGRGPSGCLLNDTALSNLVLGAGAALSPAFNPNTLAYRASLAPGMTSTTLTASVGAPDRTTVSIDGTPVPPGTPITLGLPESFAPRVVTIVVTAESGATRTYTVAVARPHVYFKASNTDAYDSFGGSVAISADGLTLAVGAFGEDSSATGVGGDPSSNAAESAGAVYVFRRTVDGWAQEAYVKASNAEGNDDFGRSVALSADGATLAVGAPREASSATGIDGTQTNNAASSAGAVYLFRRAAGAWTQEAYVKASNTDAADQFGHAISLSADGASLAVGARYESSSSTGIGGFASNNGVIYSGAVYVLRRVEGTWAQEAYIKASNTGNYDWFGASVAFSADGSALAVGAVQEDSSASGVGGDSGNDAATDSGAVYLFRRTSSVWSQEAYVKASNTDAGDEFGGSVALSADGTTLAVGALGEDSNATGVGGDQTNDAGFDSGAVYVFRRDGAGVWAQEAYMKSASRFGSAEFGRSVSLSADGATLAVGAPRDEAPYFGEFSVGGGAAYVFRRGAFTGWSQETYLKPPFPRGNAKFGGAVSLSADGAMLAVGADYESSNATGIGGDPSNTAAPYSGAVYVY
jgi:hypothetical protein